MRLKLINVDGIRGFRDRGYKNGDILDGACLDEAGRYYSFKWWPNACWVKHRFEVVPEFEFPKDLFEIK